MTAKERKRKSTTERNKNTKGHKKATSRKICKQLGVKQPGLGTPKLRELLREYLRLPTWGSENGLLTQQAKTNFDPASGPTSFLTSGPTRAATRVYFPVFSPSRTPRKHPQNVPQSCHFCNKPPSLSKPNQKHQIAFLEGANPSKKRERERCAARTDRHTSTHTHTPTVVVHTHTHAHTH